MNTVNFLEVVLKIGLGSVISFVVLLRGPAEQRLPQEYKGRAIRLNAEGNVPRRNATPAEANMQCQGAVWLSSQAQNIQGL